jgi:hypothetical protein
LSQPVKTAPFSIQPCGYLVARELSMHRRRVPERENIGIFAACASAMQQQRLFSGIPRSEYVGAERNS